MLLTAASPPEPPRQLDDPPSEAKVELGHRLFYDVRLSATGTHSCATCHQPARAFTDGRRTAIGATGEAHTLNTPSLANVAFRPILGSAEPPVRRLEDQLLVPLLGHHPVEMGGSEERIVAFLTSDLDYRARFGAVFGGEISLSSLAQAIAAFERTLISFSAPWDRGALSEAAQRGEELFFSERLQCFRCHQPPLFTDNYRTKDLPFDEIAFHNIGLVPDDPARYRTPSLRNVALTGPYMHDGSIESLSDVIDHYARGGHGGPFTSSYVTGFAIDARDKADLTAFLESLTDQAFLSDPRFSDPFAREP
jgi:cytochrome c peroxidase